MCELGCADRAVNVGVPQDIVLCHVLFLLYINDLPNISRDATFTMFADDTTIALREV